MADLIKTSILETQKNPEFWKYMQFDFFARRDWIYLNPKVLVNRMPVGQAKGISADWIGAGKDSGIADSHSEYNHNPFYQMCRAQAQTLKIKITEDFENPIHLLINPDGDGAESALFNLNIVVEVENHKRASLWLDVDGNPQASYFMNLSAHFNIGKSAQLTVYHWNKHGRESGEHSYFNYTVNEQSQLNIVDSCFSGVWNRNNNFINIVGTGAEVNIFGSYLGQNNDFADHHTKVLHSVGSSTSRIFYKGILNDNSRTVFNGQIEIKSLAQKTSSNMLNKNLVLSPKAELFTKPDLQIAADDVKASHGATVGELQKEELFYLQSRGLSVDQAKKLLLRAFLKEISDNITNEAMKAEFNKNLQEQMEAKHVH